MVSPPKRPGLSPQESLDWEQVRVFLAVLREGSLSGASLRLGLDISTVSRKVDRLEKQVGAALFDRTRDGTTPTVLGEQIFPHAEEMELAAIRFASAGAQVETEVEGTIRIAVFPGIADRFVAPALAQLQARHPRLCVELDASVGYADLTRREADLAVRATRPTSGELLSVKMLTAQSVLVTGTKYAAELGRLRSLDDARWISWGRDLAHLPDATWLRKHAPNAVPVLRTSHFASQLAAARAGLGVALAPAPFATDGLVELTPTRALHDAWSDLPVASLWLVGHRALRNVPRVAAVWTFLLEVFGGAASAKPGGAQR